MIKSSFLILVLLICVGCNGLNYKPDDLHKVSQEELQELMLQGTLSLNDSVIYKNVNGETIPVDSVRKIPNIKEDWFLDLYKNDQNEIKEIVVRKATEEDHEWRTQLQEKFRTEKDIEIPIVDVDCSELKEILKEVYSADSEMRSNGTLDPQIDQQNLSTVVSIIEKCGIPNLREVDEAQMTAIWVAFQHGDNATRKKYLPILEQAAKNGDLKTTQIAMMKDRILMEDGEPQIYGTQIVKNNGKWVLYNLEEPETVNKRRAKIGFNPLEDYLKRWDIAFDVKQKD